MMHLGTDTLVPAPAQAPLACIPLIGPRPHDILGAALDGILLQPLIGARPSNHADFSALLTYRR